jgi:uncharacterized protein YcbK (DUF882 family)
MKFFNILKGQGKSLCLGLSQDEFDCKCKNPSCKVTPIHQEFLDAYEALRKKLNVPLRITSGYRCPLHNYNVGGTARSYHQHGMAVDFAYENAVTNYPVDIILKHAHEAGFQFCYYHKDKNFIHCQIGRFS